MYIVHSSRVKSAGVAFIAAVMVGASIAISILIRPLGFLVGALGLAWFGPFLIFLLFRTVVRRPAVTITEDGVCDTAWALGTGLVRWDEISDIGIFRHGLSRWLALVPHDPEQIWSRMPTMKRFASHLMAPFVPSPFIIPEYGIEGSLDDLFDRVRSYYETYIKAKA